MSGGSNVVTVAKPQSRSDDGVDVLCLMGVLLSVFVAQVICLSYYVDHSISISPRSLFVGGKSIAMMKFALNGIMQSTLDRFCSHGHDFLALPRIINSFSDREFHKRNIQSCLSRFAVLRGMYDLHHAGCNINPKTMVLIWDTGASAGLTPFRSDFIDYVEVDFEIRDVTKANKVVGIGTTLHRFVDDKGRDVYLPMVAYHLPTTDVRLFSPQIYHQLHGGSSTVQVIMLL